MTSRRTVVIAASGAGVIAAHLAAGAFFSVNDPYSTEIFPPCPVLAATGWQCPGCGGTRAAYSLMHGDIAQSAAMNPLLLALYLAGALLAGSAMAKARPRLSNGLAFGALGVVLAAGLYTGVVRNLLGL